MNVSSINSTSNDILVQDFNALYDDFKKDPSIKNGNELHKFLAENETALNSEFGNTFETEFNKFSNDFAKEGEKIQPDSQADTDLFHISELFASSNRI